MTEWQLIHVVSHLFIHSGKCMELYQNAGHFYRYVRYSFEQNREKVTVIHAQTDNVYMGHKEDQMVACSWRGGNHGFVAHSNFWKGKRVISQSWASHAA